MNKPKPQARKPIERENPNWVSTVDGARMWQTLERFLANGPRIAGTIGSLKAQAMIRNELAAAGVKDVRDQRFTEKTPNGNVNFNNLIGVLPGKRREGIAIAAHYDTKELKDLPDFVGANDAASAVVVVFELARQLAAAAGERELTYYFIFFDGEEAFRRDWNDWHDETGQDDNTYGSRWFVKKMGEDGAFPVKALVLLDMVGDKDFSLAKAGDFSPELLEIFTRKSKDTFGVDFFVQAHATIGDDYTPFIKANIPAIDLIDFKYGRGGGLDFWHTHEDTIDKLDKRSLERTGTLVLASLPDVERMVLRRLSTPK